MAAPRCDQRPAPLTGYSEIEAGRAFSLVVVEEGGTWVPASPLRSPLHHASAIDWRDDAGRLEGQRGTGRRLVVVATGLGRTSVREDAQRRLWFTTYAARVECIRALDP